MTVTMNNANLFSNEDLPNKTNFESKQKNILNQMAHSFCHMVKRYPSHLDPTFSQIFVENSRVTPRTDNQRFNIVFFKFFCDNFYPFLWPAIPAFQNNICYF